MPDADWLLRLLLEAFRHAVLWEPVPRSHRLLQGGWDRCPELRERILGEWTTVKTQFFLSGNAK